MKIDWRAGVVALALAALTGCGTLALQKGTPCRYEFPFMNDYDVVNAVTFDWDDSFVTNNPTEYRHEIAGPLSALAASTYGFRLYCDARSLMDMGFPPERLKRCYGKNLSYRHPKYGRDRVGYTIGSRQSELPGADYQIVVVMVRGTFGRDEWLSNVNVANEWGAAERLVAANMPLHHEGFSKAADSVMEALADYAEEYKIDLSKAKILVTGHSRGAAVANLIGARLDGGEAGAPFAAVNPANVFVYTIAAPNVTLLPEEVAHGPKYANIFNVVNPEDLVPNVPLPSWGYRRYGRDLFLRSFDNLPFTGSWTNAGYCGMKDEFKRICGYEYCHLLLGTNVNNVVQQFVQNLCPTVERFYWVMPEMRAEGKVANTHDVLEMVFWHRMVSADDQARNVSIMSDMSRLSDAYRDITNSNRPGEEEGLLKWDHKLRFRRVSHDDEDDVFDPDGRDFSRQPSLMDFGWSISATHSFLTYVSWMKSGFANGPDSIYVNWDGFK